jgi:hypothetical protein
MRMVVTVGVVLGLLAAGGPKPRKPSPRVIALGKTCEARRGIAVDAFAHHVVRKDREHAGWSVVVHGDDAKARLARAGQIAKAAGAAVHVVPPRSVVGKSIGETEKNLAALFERAQSKGWVLFFDEADALFGKRTDVSDAHDRYGDAEASTLTMLILAHDDLVVFGTTTEPDAARRLRDVVVAAETRPKPGPAPPLPWTALCWPPRR